MQVGDVYVPEQDNDLWNDVLPERTDLYDRPTGSPAADLLSEAAVDRCLLLPRWHRRPPYADPVVLPGEQT
jgi:hypothetical protein